MPEILRLALSELRDLRPPASCSRVAIVHARRSPVRRWETAGGDAEICRILRDYENHSRSQPPACGGAPRKSESNGWLSSPFLSHFDVSVFLCLRTARIHEAVRKVKNICSNFVFKK